jgi:drug/metabolite transporter (DMT)-like permease
MTAGQIATERRANLTGSLWMIAAMAAFAVEDTLIKTVAAAVPVGQVLILFGLGGAAAFAVLAQRSSQRLFVPEALSRPMRLRVLFEVSGRLFYTIAISLIPLSAATVILQATPLVVVAGAALILGETVGWRRWAAILVGLAGVVVIVRPGAEDFSLTSLLAVSGMLGFAGRDLASRAAPRSLGTFALGFYGFLSVFGAGVLFALWQGRAFAPLGAGSALGLAVAVLAGVAAYSCLMIAMRTGAVSAVTPFRYSRMLFGMGLGIAVFGERPDATTFIGASLILLSGLFILWRGRTAGSG